MKGKKIFVNALTIVRLLATFVLPFIWRLTSPLCIFIFVITILLTDMLDGIFARSFHVQSLFGSILDAVADKMFGIMILLIMASYEPVFWVVVALELLISAINVTGGFLGAKVYSSFTGKTKMWILSLAVAVNVCFIFKADLLQISFIHDFIELLVENQQYIKISSAFMTIGAQAMVCVDYIWHINKSATKKHQKIVLDFKSKKRIMHNLFDTKYYLETRNKPFSSHFTK